MGSHKDNASVKWVYGDIKYDPTEMNKWIDNYLNHWIEPSYNNLYYHDHFKGIIYYDYDTTNEIIEKYRSDLQEKLEKINKLKHLMTKHSFPEKYEDYLLDLLDTNNKLFYQWMNEECEYDNNNWCEDNLKMNYCYKEDKNYINCKSCGFYLDLIDRKRRT
jgi:hypothetical protein